ncbi:hypothetical protein VHEMI10619 [[Torrubiella] hemipterigena]|uniref:Uncharacterized protein n=1 Tax=[Torrubiella] hemipterigena TaxID=1531966 RepID=A0A0A1TS66_9HYPO|nr:hypothetical protein VHEMI10619 [[Torrubiella] hemipterigena]
MLLWIIQMPIQVNQDGLVLVHILVHMKQSTLPFIHRHVILVSIQESTARQGPNIFQDNHHQYRCSRILGRAQGLFSHELPL